jgi:hypothetical protein
LPGVQSLGGWVVARRAGSCCGGTDATSALAEEGVAGDGSRQVLDWLAGSYGKRASQSRERLKDDIRLFALSVSQTDNALVGTGTTTLAIRDTQVPRLMLSIG